MAVCAVKGVARVTKLLQVRATGDLHRCVYLGPRSSYLHEGGIADQVLAGARLGGDEGGAQLQRADQPTLSSRLQPVSQSASQPSRQVLGQRYKTYAAYGLCALYATNHTHHMV